MGSSKSNCFYKWLNFFLLHWCRWSLSTRRPGLRNACQFLIRCLIRLILQLLSRRTTRMWQTWISCRILIGATLSRQWSIAQIKKMGSLLISKLDWLMPQTLLRHLIFSDLVRLQSQMLLQTAPSQDYLLQPPFESLKCTSRDRKSKAFFLPNGIPRAT